MQKIFYLLFSLTIAFSAQASTCPSVSDIQQGIWQQWRIVSIDSANPASAAEVTHFQQTIGAFKLAEWMRDAPEGEAHCYYQSQLGDENSMYMTHDTLQPDNHNHQWQMLNNDVYQCRASSSACLFG